LYQRSLPAAPTSKTDSGQACVRIRHTITRPETAIATNPATEGLPIAAVERDTGLGKDTLRVWERRYGFPVPVRSAAGDRLYPVEQVARLRLIKRLLDLGHRPGKLMQLSTEELHARATQAPSGDRKTVDIGGHLLAYLEMCTVGRAAELRVALAAAVARLGLAGFVREIAAPLVRASGEYWEHGRFTLVEEHLFSEQLQDQLRAAIHAIPRAPVAAPRILLTTFPQEIHGLGLLMAEAMFTLEGAQCVSLGVQTPVDNIARVAAGVDVVALSFSTNLHANRVRDGLAQLAATVPEHVEIWCGGSSPVLRRLDLPRVSLIGLDDVAACVAEWRDRRR
jgi:MerR family transcriptional regulator, light-induced transcriptional regulator